MSSNTTRHPDRVRASLWASSLAGLAAGVGLLAVSPSSPALAENIRGTATGPTTAPGFSHPEQYIHLKDVKPADNMYPVIQHPEQDKAAQDKLAALAAKTGKKPNILIFLLDGAYMKELLKYPPQFKIGFLSNNPPVYDVVPTVKEGVEAWLKQHGFGRLTP